METTIAVLSDIHSNVYALDAVLQNIESRGIQTIVNLGDTLFGPIEPGLTAKMLMNRTDIIHVMGNCDRYSLQEEMDSATFRFVKPYMNEDISEWLKSFKRTWTYQNLLFCHGTPFSDEEYLLEEVHESGVKDKSVEKLMMELSSIEQSIIFCGHTHKQKSIWLPDGKGVVNVGSVGLPAYFEDQPYPHAMEAFTPHARYAIATQTKQSWVIDQVMVPYDYELAALQADKNNRTDYSHAIRYGRVG
ncbi:MULTISPECIES: metallophosphoesterase family protein [unclassified Paenibacillus]|uniref:metallophosphoesterase family protein n=1 Tax=unclassified Paenibacillus TaxID=185978 RepID=UPI0036D32300